jgi:hypothetical protein
MLKFRMIPKADSWAEHLTGKSISIGKRISAGHSMGLHFADVEYNSR